MNRLTVDLVIAIDGGSVEKQWPKLVVEYRHVEAYSGRNRSGEAISPPEPEHCTLGNVYVLIDGAKSAVPEWQLEPMTEALEALCLEDWRGSRDDALERRAEERREELWAEDRNARVLMSAQESGR